MNTSISVRKEVTLYKKSSDIYQNATVFLSKCHLMQIHINPYYIHSQIIESPIKIHMVSIIDGCLLDETFSMYFLDFKIFRSASVVGAISFHRIRMKHFSSTDDNLLLCVEIACEYIHLLVYEIFQICKNCSLSVHAAGLVLKVPVGYLLF